MLFCNVELLIMENEKSMAGAGTEIVPKKRHPLFKWILVVGIMLVANLFINYALEAFYPAPQFDAFCPQSQVNEAILTKEACIAIGGGWNEYTYPAIKTPSAQISNTTIEVSGSCDKNYTCQKNLESAQKVYDRNVFIVLVIAGTALLMGGVFMAAIEAVALGFSFAGVLSLIIGTMRYWSNMDDRIRVVVLGCALVALVWLGIKKFKN